MLIGAPFAGAAAVELLDGRVPLSPGALGCFGSGGALAAVDLLLRRRSRDSSFEARYLGQESAPLIFGLAPLWAIGLGLGGWGVALTALGLLSSR